MLVIERKPGDVYLACALENARGYVQATAVVSDHHVGLVRPIKTLVSTRKSLTFNLITYHNNDRRNSAPLKICYNKNSKYFFNKKWSEKLITVITPTT